MTYTPPEVEYATALAEPARSELREILGAHAAGAGRRAATSTTGVQMTRYAALDWRAGASLRFTMAAWSGY